MNQEELAMALSAILRATAERAAEGVSLKLLESTVEHLIATYGVTSINKGYVGHVDGHKPFPAVVCLGVNNIIAHGVPSDYVLMSGDMLSIDMGITKDGACADAALTIGIGDISNADERLLRHAKKALYECIRMVKPGVDVVDMGKQLDFWVLQRGYVTSRMFYGHGIGKGMHEDPLVPHFDVADIPKYPDIHYLLKIGDVICLEPYLTYKDRYGILLGDDWTTVTRDGKKSAMFEHMVKVTESGYTILTDHIEEDVAV